MSWVMRPRLDKRSKQSWTAIVWHVNSDTQEGSTLIYELRNYRVTSTPMMTHLHDRFENHVIPLFEQHDIHVAGAFETFIGEEMPNYVYLLRWRDLTHRDEAFGSFYADDRWWQIRKATTEKAGGEMLRSYSASLLRAAPYSPMQ